MDRERIFRGFEQFFRLPQRQPVQSSIQGDVEPLSRTYGLPRMPRYALAQRGDVCQGLRQNHLRSGPDAGTRIARFLFGREIQRKRTKSGRQAFGGNKFAPAIFVRRGFGVPDPFEGFQYAFGRRKPAYKPCKFVG